MQSNHENNRGEFCNVSLRNCSCRRSTFLLHSVQIECRQLVIPDNCVRLCGRILSWTAERPGFKSWFSLEQVC